MIMMSMMIEIKCDEHDNNKEGKKKEKIRQVDNKLKKTEWINK